MAFSRRKKAETSREVLPYLEKFQTLSQEVLDTFSRSFGPFLEKFWTLSREVQDPFSRSHFSLSPEVLDLSRVLDPISRSLGHFLEKFRTLSREVLDTFSRSLGPFLEKPFFPFSRKNTLLENAIFSRIYCRFFGNHPKSAN